jgi:hypothetical protein
VITPYIFALRADTAERQRAEAGGNGPLQLIFGHICHLLSELMNSLLYLCLTLP